MEKILGLSGLLIMLLSITSFADINKDLIKAAKKGKADDVYQLLRNGADVNVKGRKNMTPLHLASIKGHIEVVRILLENGADINARDKKGRIPQELALAKKRMKVLALLKKQRMKYDWERAKEQNSISGYNDFINKYPEGKHSNEARDKVKQLLFAHSIKNNTISEYHNFLERYPSGKLAEEIHHHLRVKHFEQARSQRSEESYQGFLELYPEGEDSEQIRMGLDKIITLKNNRILGEKLINAAEDCDLAKVKQFIALGGNDNLKNEALMYVVRKIVRKRLILKSPSGGTRVVEGEVLNMGMGKGELIEINSREKARCVETLQYLLKEGADPNALKYKGYEPGSAIPVFGSRDVVKLSSGELGTIVSARTGEKSALDLAILENAYDIVEILGKAGAK
ncbi:MAG: ankyrin repeat domain-containing protein [Deltaproteobacteria bacterium]|nr:ankyrin repeat domain-containing protein [Deltaproteobacteria bacterium]